MTIPSSSVISTLAEAVEGARVYLLLSAIPLPLRHTPSASGFSLSFIRSAILLRHSSVPILWVISPVTFASPSRRMFFRLISTGSIPSFSASISMCDSIAKSNSGLPRPRKPVAIGLLVYTPRESNLKCGIR